jgi:hypothetical protein
LWGRLGYDPETSPQLLKGLIKNRFPLSDASALYDSWQSASQIIPLLNRARYVPWDYMWWVEGCRGNLLDKSIQGFHTVNIFLDERWGGMEGSGIIGIPDFVFKDKTSGTTPLQVATQLEELAAKALTTVSTVNDGGNVELRETMQVAFSQAVSIGDRTISSSALFAAIIEQKKVELQDMLRQYALNAEDFRNVIIFGRLARGLGKQMRTKRGKAAGEIRAGSRVNRSWTSRPLQPK